MYLLMFNKILDVSKTFKWKAVSDGGNHVQKRCHCP